jgi:predicted PurR-regulated permease PerM
VFTNLPPVTSPPWSTTAKRLTALIVLTLAYLLARQVDAIAWNSIIITLVLAYLLSPVVTFFERRLRLIPNRETRRSLSVLLTWLMVLSLFGLMIWLVVPATVKQARQFADDLPRLLEDAQSDLESVLGRPITIGNFTVVPWDELERLFGREEGEEEGDISGAIQDAVLSLADPALGVVGGALNFLITTIFVLTMLFYLMRDGPMFVAGLIRAVPESYQGDARRLLHELGMVWSSYLRGQVVLSLTMAVVVYLVSLGLGLPQPLLLGLIAGFLEFIPTLGPALAQIPALLFALTTDSATIPALDAGIVYAIVVSVTYMIVQQLEAVFLVPRVLGSSLDLHPFVVLVAILIGASLAGVLGVVLAAPTVATVRLFVRYLRVKLVDEEHMPAARPSAAGQHSLLYRLMHYFISRRYPIMATEHLDEPPPAPHGSAR